MKQAAHLLSLGLWSGLGLITAVILLLISPTIHANEAQKTVVIESKVTGTQEQPKVLYIMPWQGITNPVSINDNNWLLTLPEFRPINPKTFKKAVRDFSVNQTLIQEERDQVNE